MQPALQTSSCPWCNISFKSRRKLKDHINNNHQGQLQQPPSFSSFSGPSSGNALLPSSSLSRPSSGSTLLPSSLSGPSSGNALLPSSLSGPSSGSALPPSFSLSSVRQQPPSQQLPQEYSSPNEWSDGPHETRPTSDSDDDWSDRKAGKKAGIARGISDDEGDDPGNICGDCIDDVQGYDEGGGYENHFDDGGFDNDEDSFGDDDDGFDDDSDDGYYS